MIHELKSHITTAYVMLIFDFADPENIDKAKLEETLKCPLEDLFDKQKTVDRAKKNMKADFNKLLSIYFNHFQTQSGFDAAALKSKLDAHEKNFVRHLGKDRVKYLRLLVSMFELLQERPRGLLFGVA